MNQDNGGRDGRDGNRGRQPSNNSGRNGNQQKRHRSPTSDNDHSRGRQARRRDGFNQDMQQVALMRQAQSLTASLNLDPSIRAPMLLQEFNVSLRTTEELQQDLRHAPRNHLWAAACLGNLGPQQPDYVLKSALRRQQGSRRLVNRSPAPAVQETHGKKCKICDSRFHVSKDCARLEDDVSKHNRATGFKKWCPHHEAPHAIDECKQQWTWLRDARLVKKYLVKDCANGPAFATNIIDWRSLLQVGDDIVTEYPWTPEFAIDQALADPDFHERRLREVDPATADIIGIVALEPQTENGRRPQFGTYAELQAHAEAEYQAFQITLQQRRAAGQQKEQESLIAKLNEWHSSQQKEREDIQKMVNDANNAEVTRVFENLLNGGPAAVPPNEAAANVQDTAPGGMNVDNNEPVVVAAPEPPAIPVDIVNPLPAGIVAPIVPNLFQGDESGLGDVDMDNRMDFE
ncbi:hypothetical protein GGS24DRAFT_515241 [Hypoxylon argillaceum]|nr:hypothetical protein GGS24DRAFT_515241 [Hypoxylon argillaceum]